MNACTISMMLVVLMSFLMPDVQIARAWLLMSWLFSSCFVCLGRFGLRRIAYRMRARGYFVAPAVIVGVNQEALALANQLRDPRGSGLAVLGFVDGAHTGSPSGPRRSYGGFPIVADLDSLQDVVRTYGVQEVIIASTALTDEERLEVLERLINLPGIELRLSSGLYEILTTGVQVTTRNSVPLITLNRLRLGRFEGTLKQITDWSLIVLSLPLLLPVFIAIALLIKLDSPGPIFFRRRVLGIGGREFDALKFRTMVENGDEVLAQHPELKAELEANYKLKDDPRITRLGRFLRKTSLDELPQLINVLAGQMSIVGPRMISPEEAEMYGTMHLNLLTVKPGITGLWQVSGRSDLAYEERVRLDIHYIRNYSVWWDLQILFVQTLPAVVGKRGAY
jgi:exopolysaccharide biosynthesis polyprenyl glycosylphosphotransferase